MAHDKDSQIGSRYQLHEQLGAGGMGAVYRATDRLTGQTVALKRVLTSTESPQGTPPDEADDFRLSLSREFRTLASLRHPNIISVIDYGFDEQRQPYFTMSLLENAQTITQAAHDKDTAEKVRLLTEMLGALTYLHRRGLIHRDLKPANVLVDAEGAVKVLDFGLSAGRGGISMTNVQDATVGTFAYMAPELFLDEPATIMSDLYAVGVMAYELFAGVYPFKTGNMGMLLNNIMNTMPDFSPFDDELALVLERLLTKQPDDRYSSAEETMLALCQATNQPLPEESAAVRESFLQASRFVGRTAELERLKNALLKVVEEGLKPSPTEENEYFSVGSAWLIGGESGVGKSRLTDELRIRAMVRGLLVLRGQGVEGGGLPYQLWREPLRRLILSTPLDDLQAGILKEIVPDIDSLLGRDIADVPLLEGQAQQQRLVLTIADLFKRQTIPVLLLLEDLQWAVESLEPLKHLLLFVQELPLIILGNYRDDERPDLPDLLPGTEVISLKRLSENAVTELSEAMLGAEGKQPAVVNLLMRETEGNAFFLVEVVRALAEDAGRLSDIGRRTLPPQIMAGGVQQVVRRRLARVPDEAHEILKLAAVAGRQVDLQILNVVVGTWHAMSLPDINVENWLTVCANAAVLEAHEGGWRFAHDKIREAIVADLTDNERPTLHRQVAEAIEAVYPGDDSYAAVLVNHWREARETEKEAHYIVIVAEQMVGASRYSDARILLERGLLGIGNNPAIEAKLYRWLGRANSAVGNTTQGESYLERGLALAKQVNDYESEIDTLFWLMGRTIENKNFAKATDYAQRMLSLSLEVGFKQGISRSFLAFGQIAEAHRDYHTAEDYYQQSLTVAREITDRETMGLALNRLGFVARQHANYKTSHDYYQQAFDTTRELGYPFWVAASILEVVWSTFILGDYALARELSHQSIRLSRETNLQGRLANSLYDAGEIAFALGDYDTAWDYCQQSLTGYRAISSSTGIAVNLYLLGKLLAVQGDDLAALDYFQQAITFHSEKNNLWGTADVLRAQALSYLSLGQIEAARKALADGLTTAKKIDAIYVLMEVLAGAAQYLFRISALERASEIIGLVVSHRATFPILRDEINRWQPHLEAELEAETFAAAFERGKTLDVNTVVNELLAELQHSHL